MKHRDLSDSQANAEALARRSSPYTAASEASFRVAWDITKREPDNLRDAVRMVRKAYADEIPEKLHDSAIGDDGAPRMNARAVGYIFGSDTADDSPAPRCNCFGNDDRTEHADYCATRLSDQPMVGYYYSPFRANLSTMARGSDTQRVYAAIVQSVTIGAQGPREAALSAGVRPECLAKSVALMAMRAFLRSMTDVAVHVHEGSEAVA